MRIQFWAGTVPAALAIFLLAPALAPGQPSPVKAPPSGPTPRLANGKPDFSGLWQRPYVPDMSKNNRDGSQQGTPDLPFTAWGEEQWKTYDASKGDYTGSCLPFGLMRSINSPDPVQIMQNDKYLTFLFEQNTWFHIVYLDGRGHSKDATSTWFGDSVGKWDGDTLVIDTVGFNGRTKLDTIGHPMSDQLHVIERYSRPDLGHIHYEVTIDDPKTYTKPWKNVRTFTLRPDWQIMEYSCEENNKDFREGHIKAPKG